MATQQQKTTPWNKIKAEYLAGATPKSLAEKYGIDINLIYNKIKGGKWTPKKSEIIQNLEDRVQKELELITELGIARLKGLLMKETIRDSELISAIRLGFDTTLLNKNKEKKEDDLPPPNLIIQL